MAADSEPLPLRFSDGSLVSLVPGSSSQVQRLDRRAVSLRLEQGSASFSVVKSSERRWEISAGPFQVTVLGTQFDLHWHPGTGSFSLKLQRGSVEIVGPVVEARVIRAGETIAIALDKKQLTIQRDNPASSSSPPISTPDSAAAAPLPPGVSETTAPASKPASAAAQASATAPAPAPSDAVTAAQPRAQAKPPIFQKTEVTRAKQPALPSGSPRPNRAKKPARYRPHVLPALELARAGRYAAAMRPPRSLFSPQIPPRCSLLTAKTSRLRG